MASSVSTWWPLLITALQAVDGVARVDDFPVDSATWLSQYIATDSSNLPAVHASIASAEAIRSTDADYLEVSTVKVLCVFNGEATSADDLFALRDGIIAALEADQSMSGYTDTVDWVSFEVVEQSEYFSQFTLGFEVTHTWR